MSNNLNKCSFSKYYKFFLLIFSAITLVHAATLIICTVSGLRIDSKYGIEAGIHITFVLIAIVLMYTMVFSEQDSFDSDLRLIFAMLAIGSLCCNASAVSLLQPINTNIFKCIEICYALVFVFIYLIAIIIVQYSYNHSAKSKFDSYLRWCFISLCVILIVLTLSNKFHSLIYSISDDGEFHDTNNVVISILTFGIPIISLANLIVRGSISARQKNRLFIISFVLIAGYVWMLLNDFYIVPEIIIALAVSIYRTITLDDHEQLKLKHVQVISEMNAAAQLQNDILSNDFDAAGSGIDLYAIMKPAELVGGDIYDFYRIDSENIAVFIGDVSSHGIASSLFAAQATSAFRGLIETSSNPEYIMRKMNEQLLVHNKSSYFLTAFIAVINIKSHVVTYVNAGHSLVLLSGNSGPRIVKCKYRNKIVGVLPNVDYRPEQLILDQDDTLILYTDGISEAVNSSNEMFGMEGLAQSLSINYKSSREYCESIIQTVEKFTGKDVPDDDVTVLAVKITEPKCEVSEGPAKTDALQNDNVVIDISYGTAKILIDGKLNNRTIREKKEYILSCLQNSNHNEIIIDCSKLSYVTSVGIGLIIQLAQSLSSTDKFHMINCNESVKEIFDQVGLNDLID